MEVRGFFISHSATCVTQYLWRHSRRISVTACTHVSAERVCVCVCAREWTCKISPLIFVTVFDLHPVPEKKKSHDVGWRQSSMKRCSLAIPPCSHSQPPGSFIFSSGGRETIQQATIYCFLYQERSNARNALHPVQGYYVSHFSPYIL